MKGIFVNRFEIAAIAYLESTMKESSGVAVQNRITFDEDARKRFTSVESGG
ncbi:hypothetical protein [Burkholderia ubonensis]|uniref:hypothetical protein n=1 Tax=Burkholderia ubonensis TaxID=101571 RepID=UPI002AB06D0A|nr:hypothetical protein [Burkholderia ubonensis]